VDEIKLINPLTIINFIEVLKIFFFYANQKLNRFLEAIWVLYELDLPSNFFNPIVHFNLYI
jgi:hypothetical protein